MPSSLADLRLPTEWIIQYEAFVKKLVTCPLFQVTLAQLYDGRETTMTLLEFGEILRLIEPDVQSHPSDDALRDVKDWLDRQDLGDFHLSDSWSDEIERFFRTSQDTGERVLGLALCVVNPILRWYVRGYWQHLQSLGKSLPQTCQEYHSVDPETAVQQWCEERVWGGLLSLRNGEVCDSCSDVLSLG